MGRLVITKPGAEHKLVITKKQRFKLRRTKPGEAKGYIVKGASKRTTS